MLKNLLNKKSIHFVSHSSKWKKPVNVAITGACGNIGYAMAFRIASGNMLGPDQPINLHLLDIPNTDSKLNGVKMELDDCAFPLLQETRLFTDQNKGFKDVDYCLLVGSLPRSKGMERKDLLSKNGSIFVGTGKALNDNAKLTTKVLVVGNPANTNCLIASHFAKDIPKENFHAMTRLDHDRGLYQLANKLNVPAKEISNFVVWGNHSSTMYPDISFSTLKGSPVSPLIDNNWYTNTFIPTVQQRGASIINARGLSSAASAANAGISHMRDWVTGTQNEWTSMSIHSDGSYGIEEGLIFSYPVTVEDGKVSIVQNLVLNDASKRGIEITKNELLEEKRNVEHLLK